MQGFGATLILCVSDNWSIMCAYDWCMGMFHRLACMYVDEKFLIQSGMLLVWSWGQGGELALTWVHLSYWVRFLIKPKKLLGLKSETSWLSRGYLQCLEIIKIYFGIFTMVAMWVLVHPRLESEPAMKGRNLKPSSSL